MRNVLRSTLFVFYRIVIWRNLQLVSNMCLQQAVHTNSIEKITAVPLLKSFGFGYFFYLIMFVLIKNLVEIIVVFAEKQLSF